MTKPTIVGLLCMFAVSPLFAQFSREDRERINRLSNVDHKLMMKKLGISSIRPGPSGNPSAPNAANTDEAKVQPYFLPNPLEFNDGSKVATVEQWQARRAEIKELFDREIYGRLPDRIPPVRWKVVSTEEKMDGDFPVKIKQLEGTVDNSSHPAIEVVIRLTVGTPAKIEEPVPLIMELGFDFSRWLRGSQRGTSKLTSKERVLTAVSRSKPDRVPMDFNANPATMARLMRDFGASSLRELLPRLHVDIIDIRGVIDPVYCGPVPKERDIANGVREDYWGVRRKLMHTATGPEDCYVDFPLARADSLEQIESHRWPQVDWFDFGGFVETLEPWKDFAVMASGASVLQHPMLLCGMDKVLTDMALNPELACAVLDKFTDFYVAYYDKMLSATQGRIDLFRIGDDIGTQRGPLIGPTMFGRFIAPRLRLLVDLAHSHDTKVMFHSCGAITGFIDALIEIGVDVLDPIQVSAADMDPAKIKSRYGSRICLHGSIDTQYVLPQSSPDEVAENVRRMIDILGRDGGFILAPCHVLQTDVPTDNVRAMYETGHEYGVYDRQR